MKNMIFKSTSKNFESFISEKTVEDDPDAFSERLQKTWYYGKLPGTDRPSLAVTDLMVDFYNDAAPRQLGKLDTYLAASTARSACISPSSMMAGMLYVKRLKKRRPDYLTQVSSSELFLISMMMASKFLYDEGIDDEVFNDEWAASGDLETEDVNKLERDFLSAMNWELFVRQEEFAEMVNQIEKRIALREGTQRGWFTYTDLMVLSHGLNFMNWNDLIMELSTVFSVSSLTYVAGVLTLIGATMLGTATSTAIIKVGTLVLPVHFNLLPVMTLNSDLNSEVIPSGSLVDLKRFPVDRQAIPAANQSLENELGFKNPQEIFRSESTYGNQESVLDDLGEETTKTSTMKEHIGLFNGFLSPFLTLLTLKDTLFQFALGARMLIDNNRRDISDDLETVDPTLTSNDATEREFCSSGPCQVDSWSSCWNVSGEYAWSSYNKPETESKKCRLGQNRQGFDGLHLPQALTIENGNNHCQGCCHGNKDAGLGACGDGCRVYRRMYCCCKVGMSRRLLPNRLYQQAIMDINLRFVTRPVIPVFVTT